MNQTNLLQAIASDPWLAVLVAGAVVGMAVLLFFAVLSTRSVRAMRDDWVRFQSAQDARQWAQNSAHGEQLENVRRELREVASDLKNTQSGYFVNFLELIQRGNGTQNEALARLQDSMLAQLKSQSDSQEARIERLTGSVAGGMEALKKAVGDELTAIRNANDAALNGMRRTVDEKLEATLNSRITESFKTVESQLMAVHKGLGEMREMAQNVDGLRRVLTNVKTRGTFGEVQLSMILQELLTPEQYAVNIATRPNSNERVEFAVRLPGSRPEVSVWLPIDAKFPLEDYERLIDASDACDEAMQSQALKALQTRILNEARKIHDKYVEVPYTTEFAVLYLPIESLWSEVLRIPGLIERVQRESHVTIAGPTVLAALLNSLQMGFKTLAIEQKSAEVWQLLGEVRSEFLKFTDVVAGMEKKLEAMRGALSNVRTRTNVMNRRLREVELVDSVDSSETALCGSAESEIDRRS